MIKERLEEMEKQIDWMTIKPSQVNAISQILDYAENQAERVEELEEEVDEWKDTAQSYYMTNQELREQNKRYREVIEKIKDYNRKALKVGNYTENEALLDISLEIRKLEGEE